MRRAIRPRPTRYGGQKFRSRLEARWAVFFDLQGVLWAYEPGIWNLGDRRYYCPDFWLPGLSSFVEIKPTEKYMTIKAKEKCRLLSQATARPVVLIIGPPAAAAYPIMTPYGIYEKVYAVITNKSMHGTVNDLVKDADLIRNAEIANAQEF